MEATRDTLTRCTCCLHNQRTCWLKHLEDSVVKKTRLNVANNGKLQNYFNRIQSPSKLLTLYEFSPNRRRSSQNKSYQISTETAPTHLFYHYSDQRVSKTPSHQPITTVSSLTSVQHLNCHKHRTKLAVHPRPANIAEELGKKTEIKNESNY